MGEENMSIARLAAIVILASLIASATDWLFMGAMFHDRYMLYPEIWRGGLTEGAKIMQSELIGILSCLGYVAVAGMLRLRTIGSLVGAAVLVWLATAVPMLVQDGIWMKIDPLVLAAHSAGWLVRLLITALLCAWLLPPGRAETPAA
jgi:membrane protein YqaA with SNARE-associated domain